MENMQISVHRSIFKYSKYMLGCGCDGDGGGVGGVGSCGVGGVGGGGGAYTFSIYLDILS